MSDWVNKFTSKFVRVKGHFPIHSNRIQPQSDSPKHHLATSSFKWLQEVDGSCCENRKASLRPRAITCHWEKCIPPVGKTLIVSLVATAVSERLFSKKLLLKFLAAQLEQNFYCKRQTSSISSFCHTFSSCSVARLVINKCLQTNMKIYKQLLQYASNQSN